MSTIPNSAMPHAGPAEDAEDGGETLTIAQRAADLAQTARTQAGKLVDLARENPKTAIAAGAVLAAGAAAIPLVRAKRRSSANGSTAPKSGGGGSGTGATTRKRSTTRKSPAKKS